MQKLLLWCLLFSPAQEFEEILNLHYTIKSRRCAVLYFVVSQCTAELFNSWKNRISVVVTTWLNTSVIVAVDVDETCLVFNVVNLQLIHYFPVLFNGWAAAWFSCLWKWHEITTLHCCNVALDEFANMVSLVHLSQSSTGCIFFCAVRMLFFMWI